MYSSIFRHIMSPVIVGTLLASLPGTGATAGQIGLRADTVEAYIGQTNIQVPIYIDNPLDSVGYFSIHVRLDRPDVCTLRTDLDLAGTLIESWDGANTEVLDFDGIHFSLTGGCYGFFSGCGTRSIPPQSDSLPLIYLPLDVLDSPDTSGGFDLSISVYAEPYSEWLMMPPPFRGPQGEPVGGSYQLVEDSLLFRCMQWEGEDCVDWERVSLPPYDSVEIYSEELWINDLVGDTSVIHINRRPCGDMNKDYLVDLSDLILLVNYLFMGGPPPYDPTLANVDGSSDGAIDLSDLIRLVGFLFSGGPGLQCL
ncbi:hypothetical protein KQH82_12870 [bacterium]|nr:hypothetical protein [bacterium]